MNPNDHCLRSVWRGTYVYSNDLWRGILGLPSDSSISVEGDKGVSVSRRLQNSAAVKLNLKEEYNLWLMHYK